MVEETGLPEEKHCLPPSYSQLSHISKKQIQTWAVLRDSNPCGEHAAIHRLFHHLVQN